MIGLALESFVVGELSKPIGLFCHLLPGGMPGSPHVWSISRTEWDGTEVGGVSTFSNLPVFNMVPHLCPQIYVSPYTLSTTHLIS